MTDDDNDTIELPPFQVRRMLTWKQVLKLVPFSRTTLMSMEARGAFPRGVMPSGNRKMWFEDEIVAWQNALKRSEAGR